MKIIHIVALQKDSNGIGFENKLPWRHSADLKQFKEKTQGNIVLMGRKTFESLPNGALPDRINIVVSRQQNYDAGENVLTFESIDDAIDFCDSKSRLRELDLYVIGGAEIYKATNDIADEKIITVIHSDAKCDTFLPRNYTWDIEDYISVDVLDRKDNEPIAVTCHVTTKKVT